MTEGAVVAESVQVRCAPSACSPPPPLAGLLACDRTLISFRGTAADLVPATPNIYVHLPIIIVIIIIITS